MNTEAFDLRVGDCREMLRAVPDGVARCCVTSPPYWGLRDYQVAGQIGLEPTVTEYVDEIVEVFREVFRVLADDGTLWCNLGDLHVCNPPGDDRPDHSGSTNTGTRGLQGSSRRSSFRRDRRDREDDPRKHAFGLRAKNLVGLPWRVAFALQEDGWILRSDIVWHKPNPMPESVTDRPTRAHEYLFLLVKQRHYQYDADAIKEPVTGGAHVRGAGVNPKAAVAPRGWDTGDGSHREKTGRYGKSREVQDNREGRGNRRSGLQADGAQRRATRAELAAAGGNRSQDRALFGHSDSSSAAVTKLVSTRNRRTVWTIPTQAFKGEHFATFPEALVEPCILAGTRPGDLVLDPFAGTCTTGLVARRLGRRFLGVELSEKYAAMGRKRCARVQLEMGAVAESST